MVLILMYFTKILKYIFKIIKILLYNQWILFVKKIIILILK